MVPVVTVVVSLSGSVLQLHGSNGKGTIEFEVSATGTLTGDARGINSSVPFLVQGLDVIAELKAIREKLDGIAPQYAGYVKKVEVKSPSFSPVMPIGVFSTGTDCLAPQLTTVELSNAVTGIGANAFVGCDLLSNVVLPPMLTAIGQNAFRGLPLASMTLPSSIAVVEREAFRDTRLANVTFDNALRSVGLNISAGAFRGSHVVSLVIPDSPTGVAISIGPGAFMNCENLTSVVIGSGVNDIGHGAFAGLHSFASITSTSSPCTGEYVYDGLNSYGYFESCVRTFLSPGSSRIFNVIESLSLGSDVKRIGNYSFAWNSRLTSIVFPSSLEVIGMNAFHKNTNLTSISFGTSPSLTSIGQQAFYDTNLTSVVLPDSVSIIERSAFAESKLTSVVLPASLKRLSGFDHTRLTSVIIPGSVTHIDYYAFANTPLTSLTIPNSVTYIGDLAFSQTNITSLAIPDSVTYIGYAAFQGPVHYYPYVYSSSSDVQLSSNLASLTLGNGLVTIERYAFAGANITSLTIPASVRTIGDYAFDGCKQLRSLVVQSSNLTLVRECEYNTYPTCSSYYSAFHFRDVQLTHLTMPQALYDSFSTGSGAPSSLRFGGLSSWPADLVLT